MKIQKKANSYCKDTKSAIRPIKLAYEFTNCIHKIKLKTNTEEYCYIFSIGADNTGSVNAMSVNSRKPKTHLIRVITSLLRMPTSIIILLFCLNLFYSPARFVNAAANVVPAGPTDSYPYFSDHSNISEENRLSGTRDRQFVTTIGSTLNFSCTSRNQLSSFVWYQDEKNVSTKPDVPSSTRILEEKRYTIAEEISDDGVKSILTLYDLKISDTGLFICMLNSTQGDPEPPTNFYLTVTDEPQSSGLIATLSDFFRTTTNENPSALTLVAVVLSVSILFSIATFLVILRKKNKDLNKNDSLGLKPNSRTNDSDLNTQHDLMLNFESGDEYSDGRMSTSQDCEGQLVSGMDGFMETMRSGIINIDYHSMSPVIQFNSNNKMQTNVTDHFIQSKMNNQQQHPVIHDSRTPMMHLALPPQQVYPNHQHLQQQYQMHHTNMMHVPRSYNDQIQTSTLRNSATTVNDVGNQEHQYWYNQHQNMMNNHSNQHF